MKSLLKKKKTGEKYPLLPTRPTQPSVGEILQAPPRGAKPRTEQDPGVLDWEFGGHGCCRALSKDMYFCTHASFSVAQSFWPLLVVNLWKEMLTVNAKNFCLPERDGKGGAAPHPNLLARFAVPLSHCPCSFFWPLTSLFSAILFSTGNHTSWPTFTRKDGTTALVWSR